MAISQQLLTLEEFLRLPEEEPALEYVGGKVTQKVSPKGRHSRLQYAAAESINRLTLPKKLGLAFPELRVTFGGASVVPDVSAFLWDRIPRDDQGRVADDFVQPPDIAIEVASPGQRVATLLRRCRWYVANGVAIALLIHPGDESVLVVRAGLESEVLRGSDHVDLSDILPGVELTAQQLFDSLRLD